ncbi:lipoprotein LpqH [Corynebacterium hindlerae]|uniref:lipoprotein LpqH n=1 Tax=Corynebacterium hindlerae TaxID=699041 RepID=UPI003AAC4C12
MATPRPLRALTAIPLLFFALTACATNEEKVATNLEKQDPAPVAPANTTQSQQSTGSAFLNGYQVLPSGTPAVCATHGKTTTIILGEMPAKNAASVIIDGQGVQTLSISDAEDAVEITNHAIPVELTRADGVTTVSGTAEGTRVIGNQSQRLDMTFVITAACA